MDMTSYERNDRNRNGVRVAIYVRSIIDYKLRLDLMADDLETITVVISKPKSRSFLINTWYRPPDSPIGLFDVYEEYVKKMDSENKEVVLIGDFNCDWTQLKKDEISPQTNRIVNLADLFQFQQLKNLPE